MINSHESLKAVIAPALLRYVSPKITGVENIPAVGGAILVSNHEAVIDSFLISAISPRPVWFFAKNEYFKHSGSVGDLLRWFFTTANAIPVDRQDPVIARKVIEQATDLLKAGELIALHPEGSRSPDGTIYRAKLSFIDMAINADVPIVPIGIKGTRDINPPGSLKFLPGRGRVEAHIGKPDEVSPHIAKILPLKRIHARHIMHQIAHLSGKHYEDRDVEKVKKALDME